MLPVRTKANKADGSPDYIPSVKKIAELLDAHYKHPNLWGYLLADEPKIGWWATPEDNINEGTPNLKLAYHTYVQHSHGKQAFFNLAVSTDYGYTGIRFTNEKYRIGYAVYTQYLEKIYKEFHPMLMSVDIYPIAGANEPNRDNLKELDSTVVINSRYYWALEAIGDFSRQNKVPFWLFMLSNQHTTYGKNEKTNEIKVGASYPYPTVGILRLQAMTAIAYGIQGLIFWTYEMVDNNKMIEGTNHLREEYFNAPYMNGKTTEIWEYCKSVIPEIKLVGKILLNADFQGARQVYRSEITDEKDMIPETKKFESQYGCIIDVKIKGSDPGVVITHLTKGSKNYMAIVSRSFKKSQSIHIKIDSSYKWHEIELDPNSENAGLPKEKIVSDERMELYGRSSTLSPGGMFLFEYE